MLRPWPRLVSISGEIFCLEKLPEGNIAIIDTDKTEFPAGVVHLVTGEDGQCMFDGIELYDITILVLQGSFYR